MTRPDPLLPRYRVLDLAGAVGSFAGKLLGDLGAEVIKIEPPGGDPARLKPPLFSAADGDETSLDFLAYNTNKRSVTLDIERTEGRACLLDLVRGADALIESFPPDYLDDLGLGDVALHEANARLVVASVTPYGLTGPRRLHLSSDLIAMATSGFMQVTGEPDGPPVRLGNEQSRFAPALYAALGVLAALLHRDWQGVSGQRIDVSMQEALLSFYLEQHPVLCWKMRGKNVTRTGRVSSLAVPAGIFPCKDGWVGIGIFTPREWKVLSQWFYEVTGVEEILAEELCGGIHARAAHRDLIEAVLLDFTSRQTRAELFEEGQGRNIVVVPVNTVADLLADGALAQANFWKELDHPAVGQRLYPLHLLGEEVPAGGRAAPLLGEANREILCGGLGLSEQRLEELRAAGVVAPDAAGHYRPSTGSGRAEISGKLSSNAARPELVEGGAEISGKLSSNAARPEPVEGRAAGLQPASSNSEGRAMTGDEPAARPLLEGVRVVEFGPFIGLPLTGRILAALGATVIKVETNRMLDQLNFVPPWGKGMGQPEYQALKRRITLDVRTPEGAEVFGRLLAKSDVFMVNFRRDALKRWGFDLDDLRRRYPEMIVLHQSGFGSGPYENYKLYGIMAQHVCGVSMMSGLPGEPPCCLNSAYSDYHTPLLQALGVLGALDRRRRGRGGIFIEGSILRSGVGTVATALLDRQVSGRLPERRGNRDPVAVPHNVYPCRGEDEWCAIAVWTDVQWSALCGALCKPAWEADERFSNAGVRRAHEDELDALIAAVTRDCDKNELSERLQAAGVPAGIVAKGEDLAADAHLEARGVYAPTTYYVADPGKPGIEWERGPDVPAARLPILFSRTPCESGPYRRVGEDNDYVYREILGMSAGEVRALEERGALT